MRIVVAMSGGVDSSVAAALLAEQGHDVIGVSMQLYDQSDGEAARARRSAPAARSTICYDARRVAAAIGIPHYILNFETRFDEQVVSNFVREYARGPHADSLRALQHRSEVLDARSSARSALAPTRSRPATTRASTQRPMARILLRRGADSAKDQTYFLFSLTQEQLARACFPVGDLDKDTVRDARAAAAAARRVEAGQPGDLLRARRRLRGVHRARRAGAAAAGRARRISDGRRRRRARRRASLHDRSAEGTGPVAHASRCTCSRSGPTPPRSSSARATRWDGPTLTASQVNWISGQPRDATGRRSPRRSAIATPPRPHACARSTTDRAELEFDEPQTAITPGQAVVFYDGDVVSGGGWID